MKGRNIKKMKTIYSILFAICSVSMFAQVPQNIESELVLLNVHTGKEKVILREKRHFEAPNWSLSIPALPISAITTTD